MDATEHTGAEAWPTAGALGWRDLAGLSGFCLLLFGFSMISGRPLTMHEAVLPQSAREMLASGDWLVPTAGGRPWLERPPLPQWITVTVASLFGRCDAEWIVRLPPTLMSTLTVLLVAITAARWYGRGVGIVAGLMLATMVQFCRYSWLAEQDIFLATVVTAAVAAFCRLEFGSAREPLPPTLQRRPLTLAGLVTAITAPRSLAMLAFFVLLGMTNLAKGLLFGPAFVLIPIGGYLLANWDVRRLATYAWFWGAVVAALIGGLWPTLVYFRYPDVLDLWVFDHVGRLTGEYTDINEPWWYYAAALPWMMAPWTLPALLALSKSVRTAWRSAGSPERFLCCWALLPPLVFSFAGGKHHHYMIHCLPPWAILGAVGAGAIRQTILQWSDRWRDPRTYALVGGVPAMMAMFLVGDHLPGPGWLPTAVALGTPVLLAALAWSLFHPLPTRATLGTFATVAVLFLALHAYTAQYLDKGRFDAHFLKQVRSFDRGTAPLLVNAALDPLDIFKILFYLDDDAKPLHNLTFLRDAELTDSAAFLVTRFGHREQLQEYGRVAAVLQSELTRREKSVDDRWTLFRIDFHPHLVRQPAKVYISPMQAMYRADGPYLR